MRANADQAGGDTAAQRDGAELVLLLQHLGALLAAVVVVDERLRAQRRATVRPLILRFEWFGEGPRSCRHRDTLCHR